MIVLAINNIRSQYEKVKAEVIKNGEVTLKGYKNRDVIQLLEGSHRMAIAIELGYPITIIIPNDADIIEHDIDNVYSKVTNSYTKATVYEVALGIALCVPRFIENGQFKLDFPYYDTNEHKNIRVFENGVQIL
jgi:hypothetical protein